MSPLLLLPLAPRRDGGETENEKASALEFAVAFIETATAAVVQTTPIQGVAVAALIAAIRCHILLGSYRGMLCYVMLCYVVGPIAYFYVKFSWQSPERKKFVCIESKELRSELTLGKIVSKNFEKQPECSNEEK